MKYFILIATLFTLPMHLRAQKLTFKQSDDYIKVKKHDAIIIEADSAFIVSSSRASYINDRLDQLDEIQELYQQLTLNRNRLLGEVKQTRKVLTKVIRNIERDSTTLSNDLIKTITELDTVLTTLRENNQELKDNNQQLARKVTDLEALVDELKKETKKLWWGAMEDKIISFAAGFGVGALIIVLL
ncbi:hypothetical protein LVD15_18970 [Fulvivirga maritima]|uniref:hypothetical protein n=1 Tax=Fulvivirga maritima TaxID=2904247 RepID=UPI001F3B98F6|nr:hypothetical protein [Fulvivirga maritima]UII25368.1 hypothetical protein LVD15_18970 [Fulvivirga maritima]